MIDTLKTVAAGCAYGSTAHLLMELRRVDALIQDQVQRSRAKQTEGDEYKGLFISDEEVDALLAQAADRVVFRDAQQPEDSAAESCDCRLFRLQQHFGLTPFDVGALLVCLAPELDRRYERLYGYLQDDVTKRRPGVDLILQLLCPTFERRLYNRGRLLQPAPLVSQRLVQVFDDPSIPQPTLLGQFVRVDPRIVSYLLGSDEIDLRLRTYSQGLAKPVSFTELGLRAEQSARLIPAAQQQCPATVIYLQGGSEIDRQMLASAVCSSRELGLLVIEGRRLVGLPEAEFQVAVSVAFREAVLQQSALYWANADLLLAEDKPAFSAVWMRELATRNGLTFLSGDAPWDSTFELGEGALFIRCEAQKPGFAERRELWMKSIPELTPKTGTELSSKFRFTASQIWGAARTARDLARWRDPQTPDVTDDDLYQACRLQCNRRLTTVARKVKPHYHWDDIILPSDRIQQLREICNSLKYRSLVYETWGFDRKLALGKGLNVLFAGPPGTGKTMAADIMAGELGLDLYKTDLSMIVSKYIGETEKNLSRIFAEAETSNAILFFDEADALFGKRSEVRDSHDRYANIETNYLLQKMEEHEGVVILATNFRKNLDEAFVRRLHYTIDFPFPDEHDRRRIWENVWPKEMPRHMEFDLRGIAKRFEVAGGSIRNIALGAAFLAADNGGVVTMQHLLHATRREYQKMGKVVHHGEFE